MSDDYPDYAKLPRDNKVCGNFLSMIHENRTDKRQTLKVSVDVDNMSTPSICLWHGTTIPNPQKGGTSPDHRFEHKVTTSGSVVVTLPKNACIWAAGASDVSRIHPVRIDLDPAKK